MGMMALDMLSERITPLGTWKPDRSAGGFVLETQICSKSLLQTTKNTEPWKRDVILLKPKTFMNLSGSSVKQAMNMFQVHPRNLVCVHDDLDKPLGIVRVKTKGSHNGHNGIKSVIEHIQTSDFKRIRIGIGRPVSRDDVVDYVLSEFSQVELQAIRETVIPTFYDSLEALLRTHK